MLKKLPIRLRLTVLSVLLLTFCCVGLTAILNLSASRMVNVIEAIQIGPPVTSNSGEVPETSSALELMPSLPGENSQAAKYQYLQQSLLYMVLVVALGGALTYYLSGKALKPLLELSGQMKKRTVHNLSEALPVPESHDEIADLTLSFNEMSEKLEDAFAMQKRFSQSAAHELRTPLTVLKTKVDVFRKKTEHTPGEYDQLLSVITAHTNRLASLVKDLLELTNMDALDVNEPVLLKTILTEVVAELSGLAGEKNITFFINGSEQTVQGCHSLLYRAFYNILENAIKYNEKGGRVEISLFENEGKHKIVISNTGIGIPAQARDLVFEPFYRVDKSRSRQMGGAGLGLATVKAVVEKHNGTVTVSSSGSKTVFEVIL